VLESSDIYHLVRGQLYNSEGGGGWQFFQINNLVAKKWEKKKKKIWPDLIFNNVIIENNIYPVLCMK
jgi:hypothetical protein